VKSTIKSCLVQTICRLSLVRFESVDVSDWLICRILGIHSVYVVIDIAASTCHKTVDFPDAMVSPRTDEQYGFGTRSCRQGSVPCSSKA